MYVYVLYTYALEPLIKDTSQMRTHLLTIVSLKLYNCTLI